MRSTLIRSCANRVVAMRNKYAGFTLIELCIVMAIVAILATLATPSFLLSYAQNQVAHAIQDTATIRQDLATTLNYCPPLNQQISLTNLPHYNYNLPPTGGLCAAWNLPPGYAVGQRSGVLATFQSLTPGVNAYTWVLRLTMTSAALPPLQGGTLLLNGSQPGGPGTAVSWSCLFTGVGSNPMSFPFATC